MANTLTWIGGHDGNDAGNPSNWQPQLAPAAGDELSAPSGGTIDISGNALQGDALTLSASTVLNVTGDANFNVAEDYNESFINLADGSQWTGTLNALSTTIQFINGPGTFMNIGNSPLWNSDTTISANVGGTGSFSMIGDASLQLQGAVSASQTVNMRGVAPGVNGGVDLLVTLSLTSPSQFQGAINMSYGEALLDGVKADSYSYLGNVLDLWSGNHIVDELRLTNSPDANGKLNPVEVYQTPFGTNVEMLPQLHYRMVTTVEGHFCRNMFLGGFLQGCSRVFAKNAMVVMPGQIAPDPCLTPSLANNGTCNRCSRYRPPAHRSRSYPSGSL